MITKRLSSRFALPKAKTLNIGYLVSNITTAGGGVSEAVRQSCNAINATGRCNVEIFTLDEPNTEAALADYEPSLVHRLKRIGPRKYGFAPLLVNKLLERPVDLLHVHGLWEFQCMAALCWSRWRRKPVVVTPHGMLDPWITERSRLIKKAVSAAYQDSLLKTATIHVLTQTEFTVTASLYPKSPIALIPNSVPAFRSEQQSIPAWANETLKDKVIFIFLGRIHEKKGIAELLQAWQTICEKNPLFARESYLAICGWNDGFARFAEQVGRVRERLGNLDFIGPQFGVDKWRSLAFADFIVLPSKSEGLPIAILEAWSSGTPSIMTNECNLPIGFERMAALRTQTDSSSIACALEKAFLMPESERLRMSDAARELAQKEFSPETMADRLISLYENCVAARTAV